jgi:hypothetical protein
MITSIMALIFKNILLKVTSNRTLIKSKKSKESRISSGLYLFLIFLEPQIVFMVCYTFITRINHLFMI